MAEETLIEWTNRRLADGTVVPGKTFNLWIGCTKISPACDNCYAERDMAKIHKMVDWGPEKDGGNRKVVVESTRRNPEKWAKKARNLGLRPLVFTASLADIFEVWKGPMILNSPEHEHPLFVDSRPGEPKWNAEPSSIAFAKASEVRLLTMDDCREELFRIIARTADALDYLMLTKRPGHAKTLWPKLSAIWRDELDKIVLTAGLAKARDYYDRTGMIPNVWPGTTCESIDYTNRLDELNGINAVRRFVSIEPQVGPFRIWPYLANSMAPGAPGIHWVIQGGESGGEDIRPLHPDWCREIRDDCLASDVPYFLKQWGEVLPIDHAGPEHDTPRKVNIWRERAVAENDTEGAEFMKAECRAQRVALPMVGLRIGKKNAGRVLDGRTHDAIPASVL